MNWLLLWHKILEVSLRDQLLDPSENIICVTNVCKHAWLHFKGHKQNESHCSVGKFMRSLRSKRFIHLGAWPGTEDSQSSNSFCSFVLLFFCLLLVFVPGKNCPQYDCGTARGHFDYMSETETYQSIRLLHFMCTNENISLMVAVDKLWGSKPKHWDTSSREHEFPQKDWLKIACSCTNLPF